MKDVRGIIAEAAGDSENCLSLMNYIDTDTLVSWFVEEYCYGDVDDVLDVEDAEIINDYYEQHCN